MHTNIPVQVKVQKMYSDVEMPKQATIGSAGFDLRARLEGVANATTIKDEFINNGGFGDIPEDMIEDILVIKPNQRVKIGTGLKFELPEGYVMMVYPRGSMGIKKGLILQNTVGVLDSDYRGECFLFVKNISNDSITIQQNERIAQAVIMPYPKVNFVEVDELSETERGEGRHGSTGKF